MDCVGSGRKRRRSRCRRPGQCTVNRRYRRLTQIRQEDDASVREPLLREAIDILDEIIPMLSRARVRMRMELGVIDKPPPWYLAQTEQVPYRPSQEDQQL